MKRTFCLRFVLALGMLLTANTIARADSYNLDPVHSNTLFRIHHFNAAYLWGMIAQPTGTVAYDAADPSKISFDVSLSLDHLDTQNSARDNDLKGPDWFNARQFPSLTFKSTSVRKTGDNKYDVTGNFTIHGVTKSITVSMDMTGIGQGSPGESRIGFETTFNINRSDYGMTALPGAVGEDVRIIVSMEGIKQ